MDKGVFVGKKVISIQLSKKNMLQRMATNALICLVIPNNTNINLSNNRKIRRNNNK
jgi:hypothetical protein